MSTYIRDKSLEKKNVHKKLERIPLPHFPNTAFDVVVIAASLGGLKAIRQVLSALPQEFPAAIVIVQHLSPTYPSMMVELLKNHTTLTVKWAEQGQPVYPGTVYLAPPDHHVLMTRRGTLSLSQSPQVQYARPSANPLFESAANNYRERAIGVILTGMGSDGAQGAHAIKRQGGRVLVQDMKTSRAFNMPSAAVKTGSVDFILPLSVIPDALIALTMVRGAATLFHVPNLHFLPPKSSII